jgi:hypothetical protein
MQRDLYSSFTALTMSDAPPAGAEAPSKNAVKKAQKEREKVAGASQLLTGQANTGTGRKESCRQSPRRR